MRTSGRATKVRRQDNLGGNGGRGSGRTFPEQIHSHITFDKLRQHKKRVILTFVIWAVVVAMSRPVVGGRDYSTYETGHVDP